MPVQASRSRATRSAAVARASSPFDFRPSQPRIPSSAEDQRRRLPRRRNLGVASSNRRARGTSRGSGPAARHLVVVSIATMSLNSSSSHLLVAAAPRTLVALFAAAVADRRRPRRGAGGSPAPPPWPFPVSPPPPRPSVLGLLLLAILSHAELCCIPLSWKPTSRRRSSLRGGIVVGHSRLGSAASSGRVRFILTTSSGAGRMAGPTTFVSSSDCSRSVGPR